MVGADHDSVAIVEHRRQTANRNALYFVQAHMNTKQIKTTSKFLSLILRHQPESVGIQLDENGWVEVNVLLAAINIRGRALSLEQLQCVVRDNDKQRFAFSEDGKRIRANQGHSVNVDLDYQPATPPKVLLHGTPEKFVESIRAEGLKKMARHHVHLHTNPDIAAAVGRRRGKEVVLRVDAQRMHEQGHEFFVTPNGVWLVDSVPPEFLEFD